MEVRERDDGRLDAQSALAEKPRRGLGTRAHGFDRMTPGAARVGRTLLLGAVLFLHLLTRLHVSEATPLDKRQFFPTTYLYSLSLISGGGLNYLLPASADGRTTLRAVFARAEQTGGADQRVMSFISAKGRGSLSAQDLAEYLAGGAHPVPVTTWERTRILDIYLTALLWKVFGVSWSVYFAFHAVVSTLACLCVFAIAQRLGGSYWCGLLGALGFLASPLENYAAGWSPRDTNPLWFAAFAFWALFRFAEPSASRIRTYVGWYAVGLLSLIGLGWRPDAQLLAPFTLAGLVVLLVARRHGKRQVLAAALLFLGGCLTVRLAIDALGPEPYSQGATVFHSAWGGGEHHRTDRLWTENAFQAVQNDYMTMYQSNYFGLHRDPSRMESPPNGLPSSPAHFRRCREMYLEMARYNAFTWWTRLPGFFLQMTRVDQPTILGGDPDEPRLFEQRRPPSMRPAYRWLLDPYVSVVPYLFLAGLALGLLRGPSRLPVLLLGGYFVYYATALFLVQPRAQQFLQMLLPLHVLAAVGAWLAMRGLLLRPRWGELKERARGALPVAAVSLAVVAVGWAVVAGVAHEISRRQRQRFIDSVRAAAATGQDAPETLRGRRLFSTSTPAGSPSRPIGYLLKVRGASRPLDLVCAHVRERTPTSDPLAYYTRHRIQPNREQYFFFNVVSGVDIGDDRPYTAFVRVRGRAELLSATRVDLSHWTLGLPLGFVFDEHDEQAGSPSLAPSLPTEETYATLPEIEAALRPSELATP